MMSLIKVLGLYIICYIIIWLLSLGRLPLEWCGGLALGLVFTTSVVWFASSLRAGVVMRWDVVVRREVK